MANICDITGKCVMFGNKVSKANNKTRRRFHPNIHTKKFFIQESNQWVLLSISNKAMRTINKCGLLPTIRKAQQKGTLSPKLLELLPLL